MCEALALDGVAQARSNVLRSPGGDGAYSAGFYITGMHLADVIAIILEGVLVIGVSLMRAAPLVGAMGPGRVLRVPL